MIERTLATGLAPVTLVLAACSGGDAATEPDAPAAPFTVAPSDGFVAQGAPGGPFAPASRQFTVENRGAAEVAWSVSVTEPWLTVAPAGGVLDAGDQAVVTVTIDDAATTSLSTGQFSGGIQFGANGVPAATRQADIVVGGGAGPNIESISEPAIQLALGAQEIWFDPALSGGAHTWIFNGAEVAKAIASYCGDTRTDAPLLSQIRHLLVPGNDPTATGGFHDQKQLGATTMFLLARQTPRIWDQLDAGEKDRVEAIVEACLLSAAFTSSDLNHQQVNGQQLVDMRGEVNWVHGNPNYRNGIVGQVIVCTLFLGRTEAADFLASYDHAAFFARLQSLGLTNLVGTFDLSEPTAPTAAQVESTVRAGYVYHGIPHTDLLELYVDITTFTYDRNVSCAANPGNVGILGNNGQWGGYMHSNCASLPNQGALGMLTEFDRWDGGGRRVSAHYSNDCWYVNNYAHVALLVMDEWRTTAATQDVLDRLEVGTEDLLFKIDPALSGGYYNFHHGNGSPAPYTWNDDYGHTINASISRDVIYAFHGI